MSQSIGCVALLVRDYDEAIAFYAGKLRFSVAEDRDMGAAAAGSYSRRQDPLEPGSLLARAKHAAGARLGGTLAGGRVFLFLHTDDFEGDRRQMLQRGVKSQRGAALKENYGTVAVFEDLYGNKWDLLMPRS